MFFFFLVNQPVIAVIVPQVFFVSPLCIYTSVLPLVRVWCCPLWMFHVCCSVLACLPLCLDIGYYIFAYVSLCLDLLLFSLLINVLCCNWILLSIFLNQPLLQYQSITTLTVLHRVGSYCWALASWFVCFNSVDGRFFFLFLFMIPHLLLCY